MLPLLAAAAASLVAPPEPMKGELYSAIWSDLQLNAFIGNGNWLASLWYNAGGDAPDLHIADLKCKSARSQQRCTFILQRDGGPSQSLGETAPDRLSCAALFKRREDGWSVVHTPPPPRGGHSRTSMKCATVKA
jgi:hypothetical protein